MAFQGVALFGEPGSGKTTIGEALLEITGGVRVSFASALKDELATMLRPHYKGPRRSVRRDMDNPAVKDRYRPLLQALGSFRRGDDVDYWARTALRGLHPDDFAVVDDCRYPNEYKALSDRGFRFVLLESGETTRKLTGEQAKHESEKHWPDFTVDLVLTYEPGPEHQAQRIVDLMGLRSKEQAVE